MAQAWRAARSDRLRSGPQSRPLGKSFRSAALFPGWKCSCVRSPALMQGYFGEPGATAAVLTGGWLDTGDLGFVNAGELFITGRAKDLVIMRGANHPPQEFEECLAGIEGLRPGCAVALGFVPPGSGSEAGGQELLILAER